MALKLVSNNVSSVGNVYLSRPIVNLDSSYPTGGYSLSPQSIQLSQVQEFWTGGNQGGYFYQYNFTTKKLQVFDVSGVGLGGTAAAQVFTGTLGTVPAQVFTGTLGTVPAQAFTGTPATINSSTGGAALVATLSGATVSWASNVATVSAGGAVVAAHALAGGWITDGTLFALITDNSALTATTGTITTFTPAPTGATISAYKIPSSASYTPAGTNGTAAFTPAGTNATAAFTPAGTNASSAVTGGGAIQYAEVSNGTDLSAVTNLFLNFIGL